MQSSTRRQKPETKSPLGNWLSVLFNHECCGEIGLVFTKFGNVTLLLLSVIFMFIRVSLPKWNLKL